MQSEARLRSRTVILGSVWVGLLFGGACGLLLNLALGVSLPVTYLFSILTYSGLGGLGALVLSAILLRALGPRWAIRVTSAVVSILLVFFGLVYWGNKWLLAGNPFTSRSSITLDGAALVVSLLIGAVVARGMVRWLSTPEGGERNRRVGVPTLGAAILFVVLPSVLLAGMMVGGPEYPGDQRRKSSVVLISIDALRADHVSSYGYERRTSPVIDRLAANGVKFECAFCPVPSTGPSHATMLTGLPPQMHGLRRNGHSLADSVRTLAEILSDAGYATGGFTTNGLLDERFGFDQGFDTYVESGHVERLRPVTPGLLVQTLAVKEVIDRLRSRFRKAKHQTILCTEKWLLGNVGRPFFLFLHVADPHWPYAPLEPYRSKFPPDTRGLDESLWVTLGRDPNVLARNISLYDGDVAAADAKVGEILGLLESVGMLDHTFVILTADHGENLGDHEPFFAHGDIYDSSMRVPLIFHHPGVFEGGLVVHELVANHSLFATILSFLGLEVPAWAVGQDLTPLVRGTAEPVEQFVFGNSGKRYALRTHTWKVVINFKDGQRGLHDLVNDPDERMDFYGDHEEVGSEMADRLLAEVGRLERGIPGTEEEPSPLEKVDRQIRERLRALGYLQ